MIKTWRDLRYETLRYVDGAGNEAKRSQRAWDEPDDEEGEWEDWKTRYFIYSSVLGQNVSEASETGKKRRTYVIASGSTIARQGIDEGGTTETVGWEHRDPSGLSTRTTYASGGGTEVFASSELDALGNNVGTLAVVSPVINKPGMSGGDSMAFTDVKSGSVSQAGVLAPGTFANSAVFTYSNGQQGIAAVNHPDHELPGGRFLVNLPRHDPRQINPNDLVENVDLSRYLRQSSIRTFGIGVNFGIVGQSPTPPMGCRFRIGIAQNSNNPPTKIATSTGALQAAQNEIVRIFNDAGHQVTFDPKAWVDNFYVITLQGGASGLSLASAFDVGTLNGSLWTGHLQTEASKVGASKNEQAIGTAMGRIIAHEAVTHNFLLLSNKKHTKNGLTRESFYPMDLFNINAGEKFRIPIMQNADLLQGCRSPKIPDNYV